MRRMGRFMCCSQSLRVGHITDGVNDSDEILRHAEKKNQLSNPSAPAATAPAPGPASTGLRPNAAPVQRMNPANGSRSAGIASTSAPTRPAANLAATYRNNPNLRSAPGPPPPANGGSRSYPGQQPMRPPPQQGGYDPRSVRGAPPGQGQQQQQVPQSRNAFATTGRRF